MIELWDYREEYAEERSEILSAVDEVFRSGTLILGQRVRDFERAFSRYCGVAHGVGVGNASDGLFLALTALGIGAGDEVITVSNTAVPTVAAIVQAGAVPRFVDVDPGTYLMDATRLEACVTKRTRAILPVHLFGQCVDMDLVQRAAERFDLRIVEDCAHSHGAEQKGRKAGSFSDAAVFSFYPTKVLGGYGDGGMVLTPHAEVAARLRRLRLHGMEGRYFAEEQGYNSRLDEVHAAVLSHKLARIGDYIAARRRWAALYDEGLSDSPLTLPRTGAGNGHVFYAYVVAHPRRDALLRALEDRGVRCKISYPWPIHGMPAYADLGYSTGDLPHTERAATRILSLPMYPTLGEARVRATIERLREALDAEAVGA